MTAEKTWGGCAGCDADPDLADQVIKLQDDELLEGLGKAGSVRSSFCAALCLLRAHATFQH